MLEEELVEALRKKTGLQAETLHSCLNALALLMNHDLKQFGFFDMPDVGRLVLAAPMQEGDSGDPAVARGPVPLPDRTQQAPAAPVVHGSVPPPNKPVPVPRIIFRPTGLTSKAEEDVVIYDGSEVDKMIQDILKGATRKDAQEPKADETVHVDEKPFRTIDLSKLKGDFEFEGS